MVKAALRTRSISTKVTEEEYARLEALAGGAGLSMSEWVREILIGRLEREATETVLAELLGLRTILLNLMFTQAKGEAMTAEQMQVVIGVTENWTLGTPQKQPTALAVANAGGSSLLSLGWGYGTGLTPKLTNNGNVTSASIVNSGSGLNTSQTFAYDLVNRLVVAAEGASGAVTSSTVCTANTGTWCRNYGYDAWGNGWVPYNFGLTLSPFTPVASTNFNSINRLLIDGAAYDNGLPNGAGNQTAIGGYSNTFDAENRLVASTIGSATAAYT